MKRGHAMKNENITKNKLNGDLLEIRKTILNNLKSTDKNSAKLMDNLAADKGKMLRALFVLLGGSFGNINRKKLIEMASAIELLHLATLVHDDIIDEANYRRGKSTIHSSFGVKAGIFTGDYLFAQSYVLFSRNVSPESIMEVSNTIKTICTGEINQFFSVFSLEANIKSYLKRINGKCASLFSLSLSIGAYEGNADKVIIKKLKLIGYYTGMAFQLIDDILDLTSETNFLGKPSGNDIKEGIYTLPLLYEIKSSNNLIIENLRNGSTDKVIEMLRTSEGLLKAKETAKKYTDKSLKLIDSLPESFEKSYLKQIVEKMLVREY